MPNSNRSEITNDEVESIWKSILPTELQQHMHQLTTNPASIVGKSSNTFISTDVPGAGAERESARTTPNVGDAAPDSRSHIALAHATPRAPQSFGIDYVLPAHYTKPLQQLHSHPLDADLVFFEKPHIYTFKGVPTTTSVTALAHAFEKQFVASDAIESMKKGRTQVWPRVEYVHHALQLVCASHPRQVSASSSLPCAPRNLTPENENVQCSTAVADIQSSPGVSMHDTCAAPHSECGTVNTRENASVDSATSTSTTTSWTPSLGALLVDEGKTIGVVHPHSMADGSTIDAMLHMLRASTIKGSTADPFDAYAGNDTTSEVFVYDREMSAREIEEAWKHKGMIASHRGTEAHFQAELFFNGLPFRYWEPEMTILLNFVVHHVIPAGLVARHTEKEIVCVDADVAGSIDLILYDPKRDIYHIVDHKRSDKLKRDLRGYSKMKWPFTHLDDCKGAAYALQTSIYQYILEREYGMRIGERVLLSLHPDNPFVTSVPYLKSEAEYIMTSRFELVRARNLVKKMGYECSITHAPLVDAARLVATDQLVMEKVAVVRELQHVPDMTTRTQFEQLVHEHVRPVTFGGGSVPWRKLMPESGIEPSFSA